MSEFSDAMTQSWATAARIFGDSCTIGGTVYTCVIHALNYGDGVDAGRAGRSAAVSGQIVMSDANWTAASGRKGIQITFDFGTFRVANDPNVGPSSGEVVLNIVPLT